MVFRRVTVSYQKDEGFNLEVRDYNWRLALEPVAWWVLNNIGAGVYGNRFVNWVERGIEKETRIPITRKQADELAWGTEDWSWLDDSD